MQFAVSALPLLGLVTASLASGSIYPRQGASAIGGPGEYYSLGCPNTTKPVATFQEQLAVFNDFCTSLYVNQQIDYAFDTCMYPFAAE